MSSLTPTSTQLFSAEFLTGLFASGQNQLQLSGDAWSTQTANSDDTIDNALRLTVFSQGLNLYQLDKVVNELKTLAECNTFSIHPLSGAFGDTVVSAPLSLLESTELDKLKVVLADLASKHCIELGIQTTQPKLTEPGLLVMDMDSTVIQIECIDEIAKLAGVGEQVADVTRRAMQGELPFSESLVSRVACLKGVPVAHLQQIKDSIPLMPGLMSLVTRLKSNNWKLAIASGGFTYFADHLKNRLGLDAAVANVLASDNEVLTGEVVGDIVDAQVKAETVAQLSQTWDIPQSQTVAMGDGANDLAMMKVSALGIAFHAKPVVSAQADVAVKNGGLCRALYFFEC